MDIHEKNTMYIYNNAYILYIYYVYILCIYIHMLYVSRIYIYIYLIIIPRIGYEIITQSS